MTRAMWFGGLVSICILASVPAVAVESVDLTFTPPTPTVNTLNVTVTADISGSEVFGSDSTEASGNILADLGIAHDPVTHEVTSIDTITFTGGRFSLTDMQFLLDFGGWGEITADGNGIGGTFNTPNPPGSVLNGDFSTLDHEVILDEGVFEATGTGTVGGFLPANPMVFDLSQAPVTGTTDATGTVSASLQDISGLLATYDVSLTLPVNFDEVVFEETDPVPAALRVAAVGKFEASGEYTRVIPEPATLSLLLSLMAVAAFAVFVRRRTS